MQSHEDWLDFNVTDNWAHTFAWFGAAAYIPYAPWIWSATSGWAFLDESSASEKGAWIYLAK